MSKTTIGLSIHRPEMIPIMADWMQRYEALYLEEPPAANFRLMLERQISVDEYLMPIDVEYPEFSRRMCELLRKLHADGKIIYQVEPFLESLLSIHAFFADGHGPEELKKDSLQYPVYLAERNATAALVAYYQIVMTGSFKKTIGAVIRFARQDAARFRLRDSLRAQALAPLVENHYSNYIEAGVIHYLLWRLLRQKLSHQMPQQLVFLADAVLKAEGERSCLYGPGDQLTLLYIFHPNIDDPKREQLYAARSIIYSKIIKKQEVTDDTDRFSHLHDELACIRTAGQLTLDDCRRLFPMIYRAKSSRARQIVVEYLESGKNPVSKIEGPRR